MLCAVCADGYKQVAEGCDACEVKAEPEAADETTDESGDLHVNGPETVVLGIVLIVLCFCCCAACCRCCMSPADSTLTILRQQALRLFDMIQTTGVITPEDLDDFSASLVDSVHREDFQPVYYALQEADSNLNTGGVHPEHFQDAVVEVGLTTAQVQGIIATAVKFKIDLDLTEAQFVLTETLSDEVFKRLCHPSSPGVLDEQVWEQIMVEAEPANKDGMQVMDRVRESNLSPFGTDIAKFHEVMVTGSEDAVAARMLLQECWRAADNIQRREQAKYLEQANTSGAGSNDGQAAQTDPPASEGMPSSALMTAARLHQDVEQRAFMTQWAVGAAHEPEVAPQEVEADASGASEEQEGPTYVLGPTIDDDDNTGGGGSLIDSLVGTKAAKAVRFLTGAKAKGMQNVGVMMEELLGLGKILITNMQLLTQFVNGLELPWSPEIVNLVEDIAIVNFDMVTIASPCINMTLFAHTCIILGVPIVVVVMMAVSLCLLICCRATTYADAVTVFISLTLKLIFLAYPAATAASLEGFVCTKVNGDWYQRYDFRTKCYDEAWLNHALVSMAGILVYIIGAPVFFWFVLKRNLHKLWIDTKTQDRYSFIYQRYEQEFFYWECVEMWRKATFTVAVLFLDPGSVRQLVISTWLAAFFLSLHFKYQPFQADAEDHLQTGSLLATFCTLSSAILLKSGEDPNMVSSFILVINIGVIVFGVWVVFAFTLPGYAGIFAPFWDMLKGWICGSKKEKEEPTPIKKMPWKKMRSGSQGSNLSKGSTSEVSSMGVAPNMPTPMAKVTSMGVAPNMPTPMAKDGMAVAPGLIPEPEEPEADSLSALCAKFFDRYDLDGSNTLNTNDELHQLTIQLVYALKTNKRLDQIRNAEDPMVNITEEIGRLELNDDNAWDLPKFEAWFRGTVLAQFNCKDIQ